MPPLFQEPSGEAMDSLRGRIRAQQVGQRNDCDTAICDSCNCNCTDTYSMRAGELLKRDCIG